VSKRVHLRPDPAGKTLCDRAIIGSAFATSMKEVCGAESTDKYGIRFTEARDHVTCAKCIASLRKDATP
jgi:hypothetical protein